MAYQVWSDIIGGGWSSPRISFSHDLSQTDRISPDKRKREDHVDDYSTEFEFCMINGKAGNSFLAESVVSADELFVDGKILPGIQRTTEPEPEPAVVEAHPPITIARHLSLESAGCTSPVRSSSYPPPRTGNASAKPSPKSSNKWKMFKMRSENNGENNNNNVCGEAKTGCSNVKQSLSPKSLWPFSRSSSMGGESKTNSLFCSLPFPRSNSAGERKTKISVSSSTMSMPTPMPMPSSTSGRLINSVEAEAKAAHLATKRPDRTRGGSPGRIGSGRFMIRNLERCSAKARDSPRPGRQFDGGFVKPYSYPYSSSSSLSYPGGGVRVNPVLNVPVCIGPSQKNALFNFRGLFSKKDKNSNLHSNNSSGRKKGG